MSSPVKTEVTKVLALAVLLILSIGYLPIRDTDEHSSSTGDFHVDVNFSSVDSLWLAFVGQVIAPLHARNTLPGYQIGALDLTAPSLIIPIPGNSCIQRQVTALRRIRDLHDLIGGELPVRVLLLSQFDEDATRMKALLLRKAIRPSFELWYSNELTRLSKSILLRQLEPVLLVSNSTVAEVYHAVEHDRIKRAVAEMKASASAD